MSNAPNSAAEPGKQPTIARIVIAGAGPIVALGALLFLSAGRLNWTTGWLYLAVVAGSTATSYAYLLRKNPDLIAHRIKIGKGTKTWDRIWIGVFASVFLSIYAVAGVDAGRFGWSAMTRWLWPVGLALHLVGMALTSRSMAVNPFFEKTVRIQKERDQYVIDTGPYRFVRHPGYVGFFGWILAVPLLLGSWWAFVPTILSVAAVIVRTGLEDRTLRRELPGYDAYARRVRFRLIPNFW